MTVPVVVSDPDPPTWIRENLRRDLLDAGFRPLGHVFYPPGEPDLGDDSILYKGADGAEYAKRMREGHHVEVFATPEPHTICEIDTRYGADMVWLASMTDAGDVLWTKNRPSRKPVTQFYEPDPAELQQLDPAARARMETMMGLFRAETLVGDAEEAMHQSQPAVGFFVQQLEDLDLFRLQATHHARLSTLRGKPFEADVQLLIDATERAMQVQRFRERFAVATGGFAVLCGWLALAAAIWTLFDGVFFWGALCLFGPIALLLGLTGFFMWPVRIGVPLANHIPWPPRRAPPRR